MRIYRHIGDVEPVSGCVVAYSSFNGLHLGHQRLLAEFGGIASDRRVVLFDDAPGPNRRLASRRRCFVEFGAREVAMVVLARGPAAALGALQVLAPAQVLVGAGEVVPSEVAAMPQARFVESAVVEGGLVCADALRRALASGAAAEAEGMLGRPYSVEGRVVHGFHRGATIGVPTANLRVRDVCLPLDGVYAVTARTPEFAGVGIANLGTNPTFGNEERSLETHIFDFEGDLYGSRLEVGFVERLRSEQKFDGVDALVAQIKRDIDSAHVIHDCS